MTTRCLARSALPIMALLCAWALGATAGSALAPPTWRKLSTHGDSGLTYESACAYDSRAGRLVMFGGHGFLYSGSERDDTWLFDFATKIWTHAAAANRPPGACCTRDIVFDEAQGLTFYLGGCMYFHGWQWKAPRIRGGAPPWAYDAAADTWIPMKPIGDAPLHTAYSGMVYDRDHQVVIKYGGGGCNVSGKGSTWIYDGHTNTWTEMRPKVSPGHGRLPAVTYDEKHHVVLLYGAKDGTSSDLWTYDLPSNTWANRRAANPPPAGEMLGPGWFGPKDRGLFVFDRDLQLPILLRPHDGKLRAYAYDWERNAWRILEAANPPPGAGLTQGAYLEKDGVTLFVNGATPGGGDSLDGTWAFAHPAPPPPARPDPPADLTVTSSRSQAKLRWGTVLFGTERYAVYRGVGEKPWQVAYVKIGETEETSFEDRGIPETGIVHYFVRSVGPKVEESADSIKVRTQPRAPREPWTSVLAGGRVEIEWEPGVEEDIVGYNVYRGRGTSGVVKDILVDGWAGEFVKVNSSLVRGTRFVDQVSTPDGLAYLVRSVNRRETESGPSPWTLTIPPEPKGLKVSPVEGGVELEWLANRGGSLRGYNVYRLDAAHSQAPRKLTPEPIAETRFLDATKKDTSPCKYYVGAVDARGVEGILSYGAWAFDDGMQ